jgi:hypothetical protein
MVIFTANRLTAKKQITMAHFFVFMDILRYHGRTRSLEEKSLCTNKDGLSFLSRKQKLNVSPPHRVLRTIGMKQFY